jgi:hypothetical protein
MLSASAKRVLGGFKEGMRGAAGARSRGRGHARRERVQRERKHRDRFGGDRRGGAVRCVRRGGGEDDYGGRGVRGRGERLGGRERGV